jgi:hypothetical protein
MGKNALVRELLEKLPSEQYREATLQLIQAMRKTYYLGPYIAHLTLYEETNSEIRGKMYLKEEFTYMQSSTYRDQYYGPVIPRIPPFPAELLSKLMLEKQSALIDMIEQLNPKKSNRSTCRRGFMSM